ncbi:MAG: HDOD domain-containing protein [Nitrospirae bacterium]|nr:HDOD domain-containing protein [Nitrospirota bacterium]
MLSPELILKECSLPAMPHVAAKILRLANDPTSRMDELQSAIFADPALTSRILMIANSAYYGLRRKVDTISDALFVLGMEAVKNLSIAVATKEIYNVHGLIEQKLWEHAIGVSIAAGLVGGKQKLFKVPAEECIVAGLLHDIGKAVMNQSQPQRYAMVVERVYDERTPFYAAEQDMFGFTHSDVGALLFKEWGLPPELIDMVEHHNKCHEVDDHGEAEGLCKVVSFADCLCLRLGVGYRGPMPELCPDDSVKTEALGLTPEDVEEITESFKKRYIEEKLSFMA